MHEDAAPCHLIGFYRIGDTDKRFADEPHVTVHTTMIGKVERTLLLSRRIRLIIAVICLDGNQTVVTSLHALFRQIDRYG